MAADTPGRRLLPAGRVLLWPREAARVTVGGVEWRVDGAVAVRADLLRRYTSSDPLELRPGMGRILARWRSAPSVPAAQVGWWHPPGAPSIRHVLYTAGCSLHAHGAPPWETLLAAGLTPRKLTAEPVVTWWGPVRGRTRMLAAVMGVRLWTADGITGMEEGNDG
jgi:hypothetical protein